MREIKFRGKRVDNGEWAYGFYKCINIYNHYTEKDEHAHYITEACHEDFEHENTHEVIPETVGQYTGLKDNNGVEIYEGDIIADVDEDGVSWMPAAVQWGVYDIGCNGFEYSYEVVGPYVNCEYSYSQMISGKLTVIGNIHQHPELLEVK